MLEISPRVVSLRLKTWGCCAISWELKLFIQERVSSFPKEKIHIKVVYRDMIIRGKTYRDSY